VIVTVVVGEKLAVGEGVKVGVVVSVGTIIFVFVGLVLLEGATVVGGIILSISKATTGGSSTAQPVIIIKLTTNAV